MAAYQNKMLNNRSLQNLQPQNLELKFFVAKIILAHALKTKSRTTLILCPGKVTSVMS